MSLIWDIEFPTQSQLLIALKLADFANDDGGSVYPSRDRVARNAQCSNTTVKVVLRAFRNVGLLHVVREGGKGPKSTTEYAWNLELIHDLATGAAALVGGGEDLEIMRAEKGAESAPFDELRGRTEPLRGRPDDAKGAASRPQPTNNHQLDSSTHASAPATRGAARSVRQEGERLILASDPEWRSWINWLTDEGHRKAVDLFSAEGAMVVFASQPYRSTKLPMLAPVVGSELRLAMESARKPVIRDPSTREAA